jgi:quercetin dioxygenase-like cupin family protein
MKLKKLDDMTKGWFVGNFEPSVLRTNDVEVAVKKYSKGDFEETHYHKIATEITLILSGRAFMFEREFVEGDIVVVEPGDATSFRAITDVVTVVVKHPGANDDKYI